MSRLKAYEEQAGERSWHQRETLILQHLPLVKYLVNRMSAQLPAHLDSQDLASAAVVGLVNAADRFDSSRGVQFKTFAEQHIRGAILDELRACDSMSRTMRDKCKAVEREMRSLEQQLGRTPTGREVAESLQISMDDYYRLLDDIHEHSFISLDDSWDDDEGHPVSIADVLRDDDDKGPQQQAMNRQLVEVLGAAIEALPERERLVVTLYYYEEMNLKEIGAVLHLTESRICQILSQSMVRLRSKMKFFRP
ncbi:FliA/WhiG family RNA polymerase sigma factor [Trichlorobacter ammonificans]|uniref:RNA polymerase sigma factor WhiG n=1 Tax=Trichlorobacter ammonificans TaxID=2916410 RepID=A0ABN8HFQ4_9BACT|nr:FliA/WhiG family RNA polymerase sigma factor [Trichlorobacter ammonificans]CAH2030007.1 RNA polymerase sigma factor WhiG [Trichlorobacter ammonificans]